MTCSDLDAAWVLTETANDYMDERRTDRERLREFGFDIIDLEIL